MSLVKRPSRCCSAERSLNWFLLTIPRRRCRWVFEVISRKKNGNKIINNYFFLNESFLFQPENCLSSYDPHGYCVIYSSADRGSFNLAERVLQGLWTTENIAQKAVILVANKADLARSRTVTSEGEWEEVLQYLETLSTCSVFALPKNLGQIFS